MPKLFYHPMFRFPLKNVENTHYAHCYIPANLAAILEDKPSLLSHGVTAFYFRDPIDLRVRYLLSIHHRINAMILVVLEIKFQMYSGPSLIWTPLFPN